MAPPRQSSDPRGRQRKDRIGRYSFLSQRFDPRSHSCQPPSVAVSKPVPGNQLSTRLDIVCRIGVFDRLVQESPTAVPLGGSTMEFGNERSFCCVQVTLQEFLKEVVVTEPIPLIVERDQEEIAAL
jgi:hypothetical protein